MSVGKLISAADASEYLLQVKTNLTQIPVLYCICTFDPPLAQPYPIGASACQFKRSNQGKDNVIT